MPTFHLNGPDFRTLNIVDSVTGRSMGTLDADGSHPSPDLATIAAEREERSNGAHWSDTPGPSKDGLRVVLPTECGCSFGRSPHSILHEVLMPRKKKPEATTICEGKERREEVVPAALMVRRICP